MHRKPLMPCPKKPEDIDRKNKRIQKLIEEVRNRGEEEMRMKKH